MNSRSFEASRRALGTVFAGAVLMLLVGCGKPILNTPESATAGAWHFSMRQVWNGPNGHSTSVRTYYPEEGSRFLWVELDLTNTTPQRRQFNWDRCDLDLGDDAYLPVLVLDGITIQSRVEIVEPGQKLERRVAFSFPKDQWPTRLSCGRAVLALDLDTGG